MTEVGDDVPVRRGPRVARAVFAVAVLLVLATAFLGAPGIWEPDGGRYTDVALEMIRLDDFVVPHLHREVPHFTKPPLVYWAVAGSLSLFGHSELAARLPNAIAYVLTALLVAAIGRRLLPRRGWLAGLVYATSLLPFAATNVVTTDTLLTLWEALAIWAFVEAFLAGNGRWRRELVLLVWLAFGLAFLTKGYPGLLPLLAMAAFLGFAEGAAGLRRLFTLPGLLAFVLVGFWWYALVVAIRPELVDYFLRYELVERLATGVHNRHPQWYGAFEVYLPVLLGGALPWVWGVATGLARAPRLLRLGEWARLRREDRPLLFLVLSVALPLVLLFVASSRSHLYVLPLFVPLALLVARRVETRFRVDWKTLVALGLWAALLVGLRVAAAAAPLTSSARRMAAAVRPCVGEALDEIVLVEVRHGYGLGFYLDCEVRHVAVTSEGLGPSLLARDATLEQALHGRWRHLAFLVRREAVPAFEAETARLGVEPRRCGEWRGQPIYELTRMIHE